MNIEIEFDSNVMRFIFGNCINIESDKYGKEFILTSISKDFFKFAHKAVKNKIYFNCLISDNFNNEVLSGKKCFLNKLCPDRAQVYLEIIDPE